MILVQGRGHFVLQIYIFKLIFLMAGETKATMNIVEPNSVLDKDSRMLTF